MRIRPVASGTLLAAIASVASVAGLAHGQGSSSAQAEALFREGKELLVKKQFAEACPKLAASQRLEPATGTLLALALCHEGEGKVASAWGEFVDVANAAKRSGQTDRETLAKSHAAALEPKLPKLRIIVAPAVKSLPGLEVRSDDTVLDPGALGSALPIDPGEHTVKVQAPGHEPRVEKVQIAPAPTESSLTIDTLAETIVTPVATATATGLVEEDASPPPPPPPRSSAQKPIGYAVGAVGLVGVGIGAVFGLKTLSEASDVKTKCPQSPCANADGVSENKDAMTHATIANIAIAAGLVVTGVGVVLVVTSPKAESSPPIAARRGFAARVLAHVAPFPLPEGGGGAAAFGRF